MKACKRTNNGPQKGQRRVKLHRDQNNVGEKNKPSYFENFQGQEIE